MVMGVVWSLSCIINVLWDCFNCVSVCIVLGLNIGHPTYKACATGSIEAFCNLFPIFLGIKTSTFLKTVQELRHSC